MSSVVIAGDTSGTVTLAAPAVSGTTTLTLPTTTGNVVADTATQTLTNKTLTSPTISSLSSASATALTLQSAGTTALTIDTSQNVGIGTTSPATKLQISGTSGSLNTRINAGNTGLDVTNNDATGVTDLATSPLGAGGKVMTFTTYTGSASAERMRIDSSGRVGIATTGSGQLNVGNGQGFNPPVSSQIGLAALVLSGNYGGGLSILDGTTGYSLWAESSGANFYIRRASTTTGYTGGVALINAATSWSSASDENVKDIIEPIENAIDKVSTLRTVIGKYKDEEEGIRHPFLIAQDVEKVLPEAVSIMHEGEDNECLGLSYTDTIPLLVAAIKEQQTIINDLKARVETLEAK